jgi:hypothetical protein
MQNLPQAKLLLESDDQAERFVDPKQEKILFIAVLMHLTRNRNVTAHRAQFTDGDSELTDSRSPGANLRERPRSRWRGPHGLGDGN